MKKFLTFLVLFFLAVCVVGCRTNDEIKGVSITSEQNVVKVNETLQLEATVFPETADQSVTWKSENPEHATVNQTGLVTGVSEGSVTIVATSTKDETVSGTVIILVEKAEVVKVEPTSVKVTVDEGVSKCKVGETLTLTAVVSPQNADQSVVWTSSDDTVASVTKGKVKGLKEGTVTITATAKDVATVFGTIEITIEASDDPIVTKDWDKIEYATHKDYVESADDTPLKVKGVVTYVGPTNEGKAAYALQNGTEGFYVHDQDVVKFPVEVGSVYEIGGYKKYYRGLNEIVNVEYCKKIDEKITYTENNINNIDASDLDATIPYQGSIVTGTAKLTELEVNNSKAYSFYAEVNGKSTTFRVDPANMSDAEFTEINKKLLSAIKNNEFTFKGIMAAFGYGKASPQIYVVDADDLVFEELSTKELLEAISNSITVYQSIPFSVNEIELQSTVEGWDGVSITWESDNALIDVTTGTVNHSSENVTVMLTAHITYEGESLDKTFDVLVFALDNKEYQVLASLDLEDSGEADKYGNAVIKSGYKEGVIELGTPKLSWMLRNALISSTTSDKFDGTFSIRAKSNKTADSTARIEVQHDDEYNVIEFAAATYGNDQGGAQIRIEYSTDSGKTWVASAEIIEVNYLSLVTYRVKLPEGVKRVAIVVVENTGNRVNIDNIKLMK